MMIITDYRKTKRNGRIYKHMCRYWCTYIWEGMQMSLAPWYACIYSYQDTSDAPLLCQRFCKPWHHRCTLVELVAAERREICEWCNHKTTASWEGLPPFLSIRVSLSLWCCCSDSLLCCSKPNHLLLLYYTFILYSYLLKTSMPCHRQQPAAAAAQAQSSCCYFWILIFILLSIFIFCRY